MTAAALKTVATGQVATTEQPRTLAQWLATATLKEQVRLALPRHMTPERLLRICTTELRRTPKLQECEPASFLGAVVQCAQIGLEPGSALGHVYILPFDKRAKRNGEWVTERTEAQVIIGYRGMIELARRSGQIVSINARAVHQGDEFVSSFGLRNTLEHVPNWADPDRMSKPLTHVYAVAELRDGGVQFEVMSRAEIEAIRARSKSKDSGPWVTDFVPMALKTVIRRLFKYLPVSIELQRAITMDERAEAGLSQELGTVIDAETGEIHTPAETTFGHASGARDEAAA